MERFFENLKTQAEENPIVALGVAAALLTAVGKFMDSTSWKKEVARRARKDRIK